MTSEIRLSAVAYVKNSRTEIADDFWGGVVSEIELQPGIPIEALDGIEAFSHLQIIFHFDKVAVEKIKFNGHPRGNPEWPKVGIFAQRKKSRPNRIGTTIVKLIKREGNRIWVDGLDAIDGTPLLDIKPVLKEFLPTEETKQPTWATELMKNYWNKK